jgi:endonuclease-3 related protein
MYKVTKVFNKYKELLETYGDPIEFWPQWCSPSKDEGLMQLIAIGAILVQRTSWNNAEMALMNLHSSGLLRLEDILKVDMDDLTELVRVAGFYTTKPRRLKEMCSFVLDTYGSFKKMRDLDDLALLREQLLSVYGIGPETADTILLFVLDKPSFIVDAYTKRFVDKHNLFGKTNDSDLKALFERNLPEDATIYQNYHVLKILDQRPKEKCYMKIVQV